MVDAKAKQNNFFKPVQTYAKDALANFSSERDCYKFIILMPNAHNGLDKGLTQS